MRKRARSPPRSTSERPDGRAGDRGEEAFGSRQSERSGADSPRRAGSGAGGAGGSGGGARTQAGAGRGRSARRIAPRSGRGGPGQRGNGDGRDRRRKGPRLSGGALRAGRPIDPPRHRPGLAGGGGMPPAPEAMVSAESAALRDHFLKTLEQGSIAQRISAAEEIGKSGRPEAIAQLLALAEQAT